MAYFFALRRDEARLLVVCPKNAFAAWEEQLELCAPDSGSTILRLQGGVDGVTATLLAKPTIALVTYQQLYRAAGPVAAYLAENPSFMFLDESHRMKKGFAGAYGSTVLRLAHLPVAKLIMSGTPIPNSTSDLVPQFTFLYPEIQANEQSVVQQIRSVYVRTTKSELGLREPDRLLVDVSMNGPQRLLYENLRSEMRRQLSQLGVIDRITLRSFGRSVVRLIQVATEPSLLARSDLREVQLLRDAIAEGPSPKVLEACRLARTLAADGHKTIIWSQFVQTVETISDMLGDMGADFIHGQVESDDDEENTESREAKIKRFHDDPSAWVLVANPAAAAEGISLHTVCHHAIYLDRNYNAAHYLQSEDRIHRLGMSPEQRTTIFLLHTANSVDDSIRRRLEAKVNLMQSILNDPSLNIEPVEVDEDTAFGQEDFEDIRRYLLGH